MDATIIGFKGHFAIIDADRNRINEGDPFIIFKNIHEHPSIGVGEIISIDENQILASYEQSTSYSSNRMLNPIGRGLKIETGDIAEFE